MDRKKWPSFKVVRGAKIGTQAGWQALVDFCRPLIVNHVRGHGLRGPDLEDLVQEVFVEVVRNLGNPVKGRNNLRPDNKLSRPFRAWGHLRSSVPRALPGADLFQPFGLKIRQCRVV